MREGEWGDEGENSLLLVRNMLEYGRKYNEEGRIYGKKGKISSYLGPTISETG